MKPIPEAIQKLFERCEANEASFSNDDMFLMMTYVKSVKTENDELKEAFRLSRLLAITNNITSREFAKYCGINMAMLSSWTSETPDREPDFKD